MSLKPVLHHVVTQHVEESAFLWTQREATIGAPNITLGHLARNDDRLAAHIDGIRIANSAGERACAIQLATGDPGSMFVSAILLIGSRVNSRMDSLLALCETMPVLQRGLFSAFGWSEAQLLRGTVADMLRSSSPFRRLAGTAACSMHRVDPGIVLARGIDDPDDAVRARAFRAAGELGRSELVSTIAGAMTGESPSTQFWAAWSAVLLGDRNKAHEMLLELGLSDGADRLRAFQLALISMPTGRARALMRELAVNSADARLGIRGCGLTGDPYYLAWLVDKFDDDITSRLAGEAFSLITGLDFKRVNSARERPSDIEYGPNDDADDSNVDMDEDDGLPWPDPSRVITWWRANADRFQPGTRYFMGEPLSRENCLRVLKYGYQRQRVLAAHYLCLLEPGTPLFEWRAPAYRQQRLLAAMN